MTSPFTRAIAAAACWTALVTASQTTPSTSRNGPNLGRTHRVEQFIRQHVDSRQLPGAVLLLAGSFSTEARGCMSIAPLSRR